MANTFGVLSPNAKKVQPGFNFGTPALAFYKITLTGIETNYANSDSVFAKTINALQGFAELYGVGTPASGAVVIVVNENTQQDSTGNDWAEAEAAMDAASGGTTAVVALTASGASIA